MGQSTRHALLCMALFQMIARACGREHTLGYDNFVYFDASNPKRCLAPDAFVTLGVPFHHFESYCVWEEGTPDVAFEVLSPSDTPERWTFEEKLRRYHALGVGELVVFNVDAEPGKRLRVWDRIEHDLVERVVEGDTTECLTLGVTLLVGPILMDPSDRLPLSIRLARDPEGHDLFLTDAEMNAATEAAAHAAQATLATAEATLATTEATLATTEATLATTEARRAEAEARVAELERMLEERRS